MTEKNGKTEDVGSRYASYWSEPGDAHNGLNADASPEDREARLVNYKACTVEYAGAAPLLSHFASASTSQSQAVCRC